MPSFGKRTPFTRAHLADFEEAFGDDPCGCSEREDEGEDGRFRRFPREAIAERAGNLDLTWLRDEDTVSVEDLREPEVVADEITELLAEAQQEMDSLNELLEPEAF